jgi:hypothetical protein
MKSACAVLRIVKLIPKHSMSTTWKTVHLKWTTRTLNFPIDFKTTQMKEVMPNVSREMLIISTAQLAAFKSGASNLALMTKTVNVR